ncbi:MAG TPA: flagellar protein FlbB, partial [Xanthobacteraceae bacterium]|nr:flagellar protein FlbB [Xanthobacteraceae bacterium]
MISVLRDLRLVPVVVVATASLFALKIFGLLAGGGYTLGSNRPARAQIVDVGPAVVPESALPSAASKREAKAKPAGPQSVLGHPEYTGAIDEPPKPAAQAPATPAKPAAPPPKPLSVQVDLNKQTVSEGERAVLESLNQRRQELEARGRELDVRESLLQTAEKRLEARLGELKDVEARITTTTQKRDEAEAARFKSLVVMYEN